MLAIVQKGKHCFEVSDEDAGKLFGRYPSLRMAQRRVSQIETSRQTVRTSKKWDKAA